MILQVNLLSLLNEVTGQTAKLRKGGLQAVYFCNQCNHYKRKCECLLEPPYVFHCWVCQKSGTLFSFLRLYNASSKHHCRLQSIIGNTEIWSYKQKVESSSVSLPNDFISCSESNHTINYCHAMKYLKRRGITMEDIYRYNIGYSPDLYKDCIIVPSYDNEGKLNYFSSRYYYPSERFKYKNAPFSKNIVGFESFINFDEPVTLVEGVFDAIAVRTNAVPLFGTSLSERLLDQLLLHKTRRVNMVLDNDAMKSAIKATQELWRWGINVHVVKLNEKDPSEMGFDRVHDLIEQSKPFEFSDLIYSKLLI